MKDRILEILKEIRSDIDYENEKAMFDDGILESFDVIQIVTTLMDEFDIVIDADDIEPENLNSFDAICEMVQNRLNAK
jgi:acyl carrier protein